MEQTENETDKLVLQDNILQFFSYVHLPVEMAAISKPFCDLAYNMVMKLPRNAERTTMLRKLLEAKDCAVRAAIAKAVPNDKRPSI